VPIFMVLVSAMLEFGFAFSDRLTLGNATRGGSRIGAGLVTGMDTTCTGDPAEVDVTIIASIQNVLKSGGSDVNLADVNEIRIFKSTATGGQTSGKVNTWSYTPGSGPDADDGPGVERLDFSESSNPWPACARDNSSADPDSIGVTIDYTYKLRTPLAGVLELIGGSQASTIHLVDTTVMALNPTS
jgi:hypothetical protein